MTDEALAGSVDAPAEHSGAPIDTDAVSTPHALGSQIPPQPEKPEPEADKAPKSAGDAIRRANEALKAKEAAAKAEPKEPVKAEAKPEAKPEAKAEPVKADKPRSEDGKFAPNEPKPADTVTKAAEPVAKPADPNSPHREAPARFSPDAKAAWEAAPDPVKAEVHRAIRELEQGHQKYKADSEAYEHVREYAERAKQGGTDLPTALRAYVGMEDALRANPLQGLNLVMQNLDLRKSDGSQVTLRDVAAMIMGQTPDQVQSQHESTIATLQSEISQLKQQLGGVTQTIQQQRMSSVESQVAAFAKDHPRFDELSADIEFFLKSGRTTDLSEAYELAERLNPAPVQASPTPVTPAPASPEPLNPAGQKSISGAPATGSDPAPRKTGPVPSIRESLNRAKRALG